MRWTPWRPVKLIVKLLAGYAAAAVLVCRWCREPCEP